MPSVEGRVALVTGGVQGLGAAICEALGKAGARIAFADLGEERVRSREKELRALGFTARGYVLDVCNAEDAEAVVASVVKDFRSLDALINNAGVDKVIAINLRAPFVLSKFAMQAMAGHGGNIVNIVSTAAKRAWENASAYHASKWGLLGLSHAIHTEGRKIGVKVSAVVAG